MPELFEKILVFVVRFTAKDMNAEVFAEEFRAINYSLNHRSYRCGSETDSGEWHRHKELPMLCDFASMRQEPQRIQRMPWLTCVLTIADQRYISSQFS